MALTRHHSIHGIPLDFSWNKDELLQQLDDWGTFDDERHMLGVDSFSHDFANSFPTLEPFATADLHLILKRDPEHHLDSGLEFVLFVDTRSIEHPVIIYGAGGALADVAFSSFEAFYSGLRGT